MRIPVAPFADLRVEVSERTMRRAYPPGARWDLPLVFQMLAVRWADLKLIALREFATAIPIGPGDHDELCELSRGYLHAIGLEARRGCCDSGYVPDVELFDRSLVVECGTLTGGVGFSKVIRYLRDRRRVMLVPYGIGCEGADRLLVSNAPPSTTKVATELRKNGRADIGYLFEPLDPLPEESLHGFNDLLSIAVAWPGWDQRARWAAVTASAARRAEAKFFVKNEELLRAMQRARSTWSSDQ